MPEKKIQLKTFHAFENTVHSYTISQEKKMSRPSTSKTFDLLEELNEDPTDDLSERESEISYIPLPMMSTSK